MANEDDDGGDGAAAGGLDPSPLAASRRSRYAVAADNGGGLDKKDGMLGRASIPLAPTPPLATACLRRCCSSSC